MKTNWLLTIRNKLTEGLTWKKILLIILGAGICTFGIHNIHQRTGITEGGVIGMMLLVERWLGISPTLSVSLFYKFWEFFPPMLPDLSEYPLAAAVAGGLFVGIGVGIIVRQGGSSGGDDALALTISRVTRWRLSRSYLFTDLVVLGLSLTYIPVFRIAFSLITVTISSFLIDLVQNFGKNKVSETSNVQAQGE